MTLTSRFHASDIPPSRQFESPIAVDVEGSADHGLGKSSCRSLFQVQVVRASTSLLRMDSAIGATPEHAAPFSVDYFLSKPSLFSKLIKHMGPEELLPAPWLSLAFQHAYRPPLQAVMRATPHFTLHLPSPTLHN